MKSILLDNILNQIGLAVQNNELTNEDLISIIESTGQFLNLKTISEYSRYTKMDYNSVIARIKSGKLKQVELFNVKFIIDNE